MAEAPFYRRYADRVLAEALEDSPAVLIHGPRQCGKTTLAQVVCAPDQVRWRGRPAGWRGSPAGAEYAYVSFDDDVVRSGAETDPMGFVAALPERVILDEVQRVPGLFAALKLDIDRRRVPGRFVLTGSSNALRVPTLADSLAGRLQIVRLHPLSQLELGRRRARRRASSTRCSGAASRRAAQSGWATGWARGSRPGASPRRWRDGPAGGRRRGTGTTCRRSSRRTCRTGRASPCWTRCRGSWPWPGRRPPTCSTSRTWPRSD